MISSRWAPAAAGAAFFAAVVTLLVVTVAQHRYERAFALRMAGTTAAYVAAVAPPPPPPPPPPAPRRPPIPRGRRRPVRPPPPPPAPPPPPPPLSPAARTFDLASLLTQARALTTLPGWSSEVEVFFGTAPLVDATAPPLSPEDLAHLAAGARWRNGAALVPLMDRDGQEVVGAVALRPRPAPHGPLPGGLGFAFPAAIIAVWWAAVTACREPSRRSRYFGAALLLALAAYLDVRAAARQSTDRWLVDTRRLLQEAATRLPPPRVRVSITDLAGLVRDAEIVTGEPGESAPRRIRVRGEPRAVVAVLIGQQRWIELRSVPAEIDASRWLILLLPCALLGPLTILGLGWAERTPARRRRETVTAWGFLAPAVVHLAVFTVGPAIFAVYLASLGNVPALLRDPMTWHAFVNSAAYALYVPVSIALALVAALGVHRYRKHWGGRLLSAAFLLPYVASVVAIALLWQAMYRAGSLGLGRPDWLSNPRLALPALMLVSIWAHVGGQMLVFLAGLQAIPQEYFDAARVDGGNVWRRFWRVTLPLLRPVTWFVFLTGVIGAFQMFTLVFVLTQGGPLPFHSTDVLVFRIYQTAFGSQALGVAGALALMLGVMLLIFKWPELRLLRRQARHA
jgi:ABC-type sugar transport system permease subunit